MVLADVAPSIFDDVPDDEVVEEDEEVDALDPSCALAAQAQCPRPHRTS